ncbi:MAG: membrane-bound O-acyltransferase family protein [Bacteroidetes bacterium]|nr:MAG: membrane-bound O-acyltransferase family protein [Bacteroidota bacterium]
MLFNSLDFAFFLPIVFVLYWFVTNKNLAIQNALVVVASYVFYGWWDWKFLGLIILSTLIDYTVGTLLDGTDKKGTRKTLLAISIVANLGFLGFFKYYNFFVDSFIEAFSFFGVELSAGTLNIILPVGISFYTFQTMSYSIDVYRGNLKATRDLTAFAAFVSFFPQLVAGPIERATHLLPQFTRKRSFDAVKAVDGLKQILWGLFKKMVVADTCAHQANLAFNSIDDYSGSGLLVGAIYFAFQIYGDFSGYSDIAIGTARLFGFDLKQNFAFPYFSRDIAEFWRRWHISLSTWFRDYLYIPLGGSREGTYKKIRNTFIIFLVSGFWHGANWTFIVWGALHALYFLPLLLTNRNRRNMTIVAEGRVFPTFSNFIKIAITFLLVVLAWVFFRAENVGVAFHYIGEMFSSSLLSIPENGYADKLILVVILLTFEWFGRKNQYAIATLGAKWPRLLRWLFYYLLIVSIFLFAGEEQEFIYFQF